MYVYVYIYIYMYILCIICIHICISPSLSLYIYIYMYKTTHIYIYIYIYICIHTHSFVDIFIDLCIIRTTSRVALRSGSGWRPAAATRDSGSLKGEVCQKPGSVRTKRGRCKQTSNIKHEGPTKAS